MVQTAARMLDEPLRSGSTAATRAARSVASGVGYRMR